MSSSIYRAKDQRPNHALPANLVIALNPSSRIRSGNVAKLWFDPERMHIFDATSGENLTRDPNRVFEDDLPHPSGGDVPSQRQPSVPEEATLHG